MGTLIPDWRTRRDLLYMRMLKFIQEGIQDEWDTICIDEDDAKEIVAESIAIDKLIHS